MSQVKQQRRQKKKFTDKFKKNKRQVLDINNKKEVREYLLKVLQFKRTKKYFGFYKNLVRMFDVYPKTAMLLIKQLFKLGYWKDYMFLLLASYKNEVLTDFLYSFLIKRLKLDLVNEKLMKPLSRLAKWLPRQESSFDRKLKFIDKFTARMYPDVEINSAKKMYRQTLSRLNKLLDTTEIKLASKQYSEINFAHVGRICFRNNYMLFLKHCKDRLYVHLLRKYCDMDIWNFVNEIYRELDTIDSFKEEIFNKVWAERCKLYLTDLKYIKDIKNSVLLLDVTNKVFNSENIKIMLGLALLVSEFSNNNSNKIFMNSKEPFSIQCDNTMSAVKRVKSIVSSISCHKEITYKSVDNKNYQIIVCTDKAPNPEANTNNNKILYWQVDSDLKIQDPIKLSENFEFIIGDTNRYKKYARNNLKLLNSIISTGGELTIPLGKYALVIILFIIALCTAFTKYFI